MNILERLCGGDGICGVDIRGYVCLLHRETAAKSTGLSIVAAANGADVPVETKVECELYHRGIVDEGETRPMEAKLTGKATEILKSWVLACVRP